MMRKRGGTGRQQCQRTAQQELFTSAAKRRGGRRKGAGRKPKGQRAGTTHEARPVVCGRHPLHVVLRTVPEVGNLRRRAIYHAIREATVVACVRERIRIVQLSIQRTHLHLLVEADNTAALSRGLQGFQISVARNINSALRTDRHRRRRGRVFADRYHLVVIRSPKQARNVLAYVMSNWRHHGEDRSGLARTWLVDPFSSACRFPDWQELDGKPFFWPLRDTYDPLLVRRPQSWLLQEGWKLGGPISATAVPGH